jgi:hypothetical protein
VKRTITVVMAVELDVDGEGDKMRLANEIVAGTRLPWFGGSSGDMVYVAGALGLLRVSEEKR